MIARLLLVAAGIAVIVALLRPRPLFTIRFDAGEARLRRGKAPRRFVQDVQDVLSEAGVSAAKVTAISTVGRVSPPVYERNPGSLPPTITQRVGAVSGIAKGRRGAAAMLG